MVCVPCSLRASGERPHVRGWLERLLEPGGGLGLRLTPTHLVTAVVYFAGRIPGEASRTGRLAFSRFMRGSPWDQHLWERRDRSGTGQGAKWSLHKGLI